MCLVSIVTCTYNRAHLIGDTIQHILDQTFRDFEYIIVDDGSTDDTESVVSRFDDGRIHYFKLAEHSGFLGKLKNLGIEYSRGKYIAFADSDDLWLPEKLLEQVSYLESSDAADFSFTDVEIFDQGGTLKDSLLGRSGRYVGSILPDMLRNELPVCATTLMFRRDCLVKTGMLDECIRSADFDLILKLAVHFPAYAIFKSLVRVRRHDGNITNKLPREKAEAILRSYLKLSDAGVTRNNELDHMLSRLCYSFSVEFARQGDCGNAVLFLRKAIGYDRLFWKIYPRLFLTLIKSRLK